MKSYRVVADHDLPRRCAERQVGLQLLDLRLPRLLVDAACETAKGGLPLINFQVL